MNRHLLLLKQMNDIALGTEHFLLDAVRHILDEACIHQHEGVL
jgi:hypothetical protein